MNKELQLLGRVVRATQELDNFPCLGEKLLTETLLLL